MKETGNPVLPPSPLLGSGMAWMLISMRLPHISSDGVSSRIPPNPACAPEVHTQTDKYKKRMVLHNIHYLHPRAWGKSGTIY